MRTHLGVSFSKFKSYVIYKPDKKVCWLGFAITLSFFCDCQAKSDEHSEGFIGKDAVNINKISHGPMLLL